MIPRSIVKLTVHETYLMDGFTHMVEEYAQITDPLLPPPTYRREDYLPLEEKGLLGVYGALEGKMIVGFAAVIKGKMPHYGTTIAIVESLFVRADCRAHGHGLRLIEACEDYARINGLPEIFINVHDEYLHTLGIILERRNYSARIHTYGRRL